MKDNENNNNTSSMQEEDSQELNIDPTFAKAMYECYKKQQIQSPPELHEKLMEIARAHKRKVAAEGKLNNQDWLSWRRPMIFPMVENLLAWLFKTPVLVVVTILITISIGGFYYFSQKRDSTSVANNKNSIPKATIASIDTNSPNISESNKIESNTEKNEVAINKLNENESTLKEISKASTNFNRQKHNTESLNSSKTRTLEMETQENTSKSNIEIANKNDSEIRSAESETENTSENNGTEPTFTSIQNVYLEDLIDEDNVDAWMVEFTSELKVKIKEQHYWVVEDKSNIAEANLAFEVREGQLVLIPANNPDHPLWTGSIKLKEGNAKEAANIVVKELFDKFKKNKQD
jgi:hypothetical protein